MRPLILEEGSLDYVNMVTPLNGDGRNRAIVFRDVLTTSVIGADAVVTKPIHAKCVAANNPARVIRTLR